MAIQINSMPLDEQKKAVLRAALSKHRNDADNALCGAVSRGDDPEYTTALQAEVKACNDMLKAI